MPQGKNRYPGIRSFEPDDQRLFYGRSQEIEQLFNLIKIKPLVVLFGKSGLGKTSLLKAGVGPLLLRHHYFPVMIRLQDVGIPPSTSVLNALEQFIDNDLLNQFGSKSKNKIWEALKAASFKTADGIAATPLLIFDQFEELFSHPKDVQEEFTAFIGDLSENRLPADIEYALNEIPRSERSKELMAWYQPPNVKIVFAIRSDRMSELHSLRFEIPAILQNRYELKPLKTHQAKEAVEKPAALEGKEFLTTPFTYAPETIEKIQTELSNEFGEIESFQLQIICQYIERKVKKEQNEGTQNIVVTPDYLGEKEGIKGILKNYYNTQISLLGTNEEQLAARVLLEEGLIVNKRRIGVAEAVVKETYSISDELLEKLLMCRLIRPEDTRLGRTYEISHDTLVEPILDAFQKRKLNEERMEEIRERFQIQKKQKRARIASVINLIIAVASIIFASWVYKTNQAKEECEDIQKELTQNQKKLTEQKAELEQTIKELEQTATELDQKQDALVTAQDSIASKEEKLEASIAILEEKTGISGATANKEIIKKEQSIKIEKARENPENHADHEKLIASIYSENEGIRTKTTSYILRRYKNDSKLISEILDSTSDKINEENLNSLYQIIYILQQLDAKILDANKDKITVFIQEVRNAKNTENGADLVGISTKSRLDNIEKKLN